MELTDRQIEIIQAATKLIGVGGVQSLTTKTLAAEIGFSEPALYRHFSDKNEILKSVLLFYKEQLRAGIEGIAQEKIPEIEKIKSIIDFQFGHFTKNPAVIMVIFSETSFQHDNILSQMVLEIMKQKHESMANILGKGQADGSIRSDISDNQLATIIMGSMRFTILRWRLSNFQFDLLPEGDQLWKTIELLIKKH